MEIFFIIWKGFEAVVEKEKDQEFSKEEAEEEKFFSDPVEGFEPVLLLEFLLRLNFHIGEWVIKINFSLEVDTHLGNITTILQSSHLH